MEIGKLVNAQGSSSLWTVSMGSAPPEKLKTTDLIVEIEAMF